MSKFTDFSNCGYGYRKYGGSDTKQSIIYNGKYYMLKFTEHRNKQIDIQTSSVNNVISEYIGSHIIQTLGLPVHNTILGEFKGELCVACEDFVEPGYNLQEFKWFMQIGRAHV